MYTPAMAKIRWDAWRCERCGHEWAPRVSGEAPRVCPKCKSPYWDRGYKSEATAANAATKRTVKAAPKPTKRAAPKGKEK